MEELLEELLELFLALQVEGETDWLGSELSLRALLVLEGSDLELGLLRDRFGLEIHFRVLGFSL